MDLKQIKSMREREEKLFLDEETTMEVICANVASGGSLTKLCKTWDIRFWSVMKWIREDKDRSKRYDDSIRDRGEWAKETLLMELQAIALSDIRQIYNDDGSLKDVSEWPDEVASVVSSLETVEEFQGKGKDKESIGYNKKLKLWNKEKALELLGKYHDLFMDRLHHSGAITLEDLVTQSREEEDGE
jgi:hypothetical protein